MSGGERIGGPGPHSGDGFWNSFTRPFRAAGNVVKSWFGGNEGAAGEEPAVPSTQAKIVATPASASRPQAVILPNSAADYEPGPATGFSGVYDPTTGKFAIRPSGNTLLRTGEVPVDRVDRFGGHSQLNDELTRNYGVKPSGTVGFVVYYDAPGELSVTWRSGSVNRQNFYDPAAPVRFRQPLLDDLHAATGTNVRSR